MSFLRRSSSPHPTSPPLFSTFLLPSIPFRNRRRRSRQSSTDSDTSGLSSSTAATSPSTSPATTTLHPKLDFGSPTTLSSPTGYLSGHTPLLRCAKCSADLCYTSQIISKGFTGRHGRAYLVQGQPSSSSPFSPTATGGSTGAILPNTHANKPVPRQLVTGHHTVSDISCAGCGSVLGWKYVAAQEESQRYKVGKFILETKRVRGAVDWEHGQNYSVGHGGGGDEVGGKYRGGIGDGEEEDDDDEGEVIEFDSQDEDECEDLFAGVWSAELAVKRRRGRRRFGRNGGGGSGGSGVERARSEDVR